MKSADGENSLEIQSIRIPKKIHEKFNNAEIKTVASLLNRAEEIQKWPNSKDTNARTIFDRWLTYRWEIDCDENIQFLKSMNISTPDRNIIFKKAEELKTSYTYENDKNVVLIDYQEADKEVLKERVSKSTTKKSLGISQSSLSLRWDRACEKIQDDKKGRKHLDYYVYHTSFNAGDVLWKDEKEKLENRLDCWLVPKGYSYKIIEMDFKRQKVVL